MESTKFTMNDDSGNTPATNATSNAITPSIGSNSNNKPAHGNVAAPVITRTTSGLSHDTSSKASITSNTTGGQQTRFSFYNADDFKVTSVIATSTNSIGNNITDSADSIHSIPKSPRSLKIKHAVVQTVTAQPQHEIARNHSDDAATNNTDIDSNEILRSLQEHEQQRLDILAGPKRKVNSTTGGTTISSNSSNTYHTSTGKHEEENSNPYEEAIKEALQLIRRHRAPIISDPQSSTGSLLHQPTPRSGPSYRTTTENITSDERNYSTNEVNNRQRNTRRLPTFTSSHDNGSDCIHSADFHQDHTARSNAGFDHLVASSTRSLPGGSLTQTGNMEQDTTTAPLHPFGPRSNNHTNVPVPSNPGLGEAYQAEIEARRRQRQERMARYASRLAELKQEDQHNLKDGLNTNTGGSNRMIYDDDDIYDDGIPMVDTARSLDSSVDYGSSGIARGVVMTSRQNRTNYIQNNNYNSGTAATAATNIGASRSWEDDIMISLSRSSHQDGGRFDSTSNYVPSNPGSVSTITNTVRPDDEIQRGVERVLLAILERANSRGRSGAEGRMLERHHPAISDPVKAPLVPGDEEKKSNDEKHDDVLVQAMSELLGPSATESLGPLNEENENPIIIPNGEHNILSLAGPRYGIGMDDFKKKRTSLEIADTKSMSSPELPPTIPEGTSTNRNVEDDDDHPSVSDHDDEDDISDERIDVDDDDEEEEEEEDDDDDEASEEDSRTYDDDDDEEDVSRSDDYDSNAGSETYEKRVLGPLSKRSGGTTGVVLDDYSSASSASYDDEPVAPPQPSSILESLSAAVSRVTGIAKVDENDHSGRSAKGDKYAMDDIDSNDESEDSTDSEANDLMRSLCAHLLPVAVDRTRKILDDVPEWDESNPDEAGYRIVRLTSYQLRSIEKEYERFIESLKTKAQLILSPKVGMDESAFELDLQAAEKLLEEEESKLKIPEIMQPIHSAKSLMVDTIPKPDELTSIESPSTRKDVDASECLACFPGVKPTGKGEMGELEYFSLPIIFKSHVTGFEPTKDIILEPGNVVAGQYLVEGVLGSAAFSTAYKCVDLSSEEDSSGCQDTVCLKVIKNTKDFFDQSLDEIKILELLRQTGKCNEKFIVEMKTFFYHREHLIIVTELLRQNLFEFGKFILDSGEEPYFTLPRLSYIARQCFIALEFVHGMGLVHSDVKPENILLASYSRAQAKLIDFGSSCYLTDRQSSYIQSRSYRAPEVVLGLPYDGRIDIWSIGCVIAEMFTGEVTFQNDSVVSMLSRIEAICGPFPRHMVAQGRQSARFFAKCGLLFEKVVNDNSDNTEQSNSISDESSYDDQDDNHRRVYIDIFQPKTTTLAARLGFAPDLMDKFDNRAQLSADEQRKAVFCDLIRKLLTIDPEVRLTATEALNHPAMLYAATLTESDVKYPSS
jgi:serine/threonine protein kinase